jgi:hypothetical protein
MRNPSVHVRRSELFEILVDYGINDRDMPSIMQKASKINIKNRVNLILPAKTRQKAERIIEAGNDLVGMFNQAYITVMAENHIKVLSMRKGNPQFLAFTEIASQAKEFCDLFELDYMQGFLIFLRMGVTILNKKYSLYRLKGASDRIVDKYRTMQTINNDPNQLSTQLMYAAWEKAVKKYFSVEIDVKNDMDKYVHFIFAKQDADSIKADYFDFICAQFEKWAFIGNIPEFSQLHGENAKLNYKIFMAKSTGSSTESEAEKKYFKTVRSEKEIPIKKAIAQRG